MLDNREQDCSLIMMLLSYAFFRYLHDGPLVVSLGLVYRIYHIVRGWVARRCLTPHLEWVQK
jgi:hypothetical protein